VLIELSYIEFQTGEDAKARKNIRDAVALTKKHGFRPALARALLVSGTFIQDAKEKVTHLVEALKLAEVIGLPEVIAEAAYRLGTNALQMRSFSEAHSYLLKSTATLIQLMDNVPERYRKAYMRKKWRQDARAKFQECLLSQVSSYSGATHPGIRSDAERIVKTLYNVCILQRLTKTDAEIAEIIVSAIRESLQCPSVVVAVHDRRTTWASKPHTLTDAIQKQILQLLGQSSAPFFGNGFAFVPFRVKDTLGGLYVGRIQPPGLLKEPEIEFLTVLGLLCGVGIDGLRRPVIAEVVSPQTSTFGIVGNSKPIREVFRHIEIAAKSVANVLIEGESGTGKELVAKAIHAAGPRVKGPFVPVDCGAIPETLIESELFGSKRGAFTGATADRPGLFEAAHGGTIFLDEISNTSLALQAKLLRVIQEREVRRIGETKGHPVDVRLIVATNTNLDVLVQQRQFRQDLLFRLKVLHIPLPPLRQRRADIPLLVESFLHNLNTAHKTRKHAVPEFLEEISKLSFPGNVRELQNLVERAYFLAKGATLEVVPPDHASAQAAPASAAPRDDVYAFFKDLSEGRKNFWSEVRDPYKRRDIPREKVIALVDIGLRETRGNYKALAELFKVDEKEYRRFMDFLRRSDCRLDFRPYRKIAP